MKGKPLTNLWIEKFAETNDPHWNKNVQMMCEHCGKPVKWKNNKGWGKFCSLNCQRVANRIAGTKRKHQKFLQQLHDEQISRGLDYDRYLDPFAEPPLCPICGKPTWWYTRHWKQTCSRQCSDMYIKLYLSKIDRLIELHNRCINDIEYYAEYDPFAKPMKCLKPGCDKSVRWLWQYCKWSKYCCEEHKHACNRAWIENSTQTTTTKAYNRKVELHNIQIAKGAKYDAYKDPFASAPKCELPGCNNTTKWFGNNGGYWARFCCASHKMTKLRMDDHDKFNSKKQRYENAQFCLNRQKPTLDSNLERAFVTALEELQISYERESLHIKRFDKDGYYYPDFVVHYKFKLLIIEIKPLNRINDNFDNCQQKAISALNYVNSNPQYHCYAFLTEHEVYDIQAIQQTLDNLIESGKCKYIEQLNL